MAHARSKRTSRAESESSPPHVVTKNAVDARVHSPLDVETFLGLDWRSLASFRIGIGCMTIIDVVRRSLDFSAHYTDAGVVPSAVAVSTFHRPFFFNWYTLSNAPSWQIFLAGFTVLTALCVIFGVFTRVMWFLSWVMLLSLQNRNEFITNGGDVVFRLFYFWGLFLPLGAKFSVDSLWRRTRAPASANFLSVATIALTLQIASIYFFAAVLKSDPDWHENGTAIFYALHLDKYATPLAVQLRQFPSLLYWGTKVVWYFEFFAPIALFVPFHFARVRLVTALSLIGLHLSFVTCLRIGTFPWICIAGLTVLLPGLFWDLSARLFGRARRQRAMLHVASFVATITAALQAAPRFGPLRRLSLALARLPRVPALNTLLATAALTLVVLWNVGGIPNTGIRLPPWLAQVSRTFGIDQHWDMFSPRPTRSDGWIVVPGEQEDGKPVDVWYLDPAPVSWEKQRWPAFNYTSERWIKYFEAMYETKSKIQLEYFAKYLCRRWNNAFTAHERLRALEVYFMDDPTYPTGKRTPIPVSLGKFQCGA